MFYSTYSASIAWSISASMDDQVSPQCLAYYLTCIKGSFWRGLLLLRKCEMRIWWIYSWCCKGFVLLFWLGRGSSRAWVRRGGYRGPIYQLCNYKTSFSVTRETCIHRYHKKSSSFHVFAFKLTIQSHRALNPYPYLIIDFQARKC